MWRIGDKATETYNNICKHYYENNNNAYLQNNIYASIIGHPPLHQGLAYYEKIMNVDAIYTKIDELLIVDKLGCPNLYKTKDGRFVGLNAMRYLDTILFLHKKLNNLDNYNIKEIGAGYGGLALMLNVLYRLNKYCIVDLPAAKQLSENNLKKHNVVTLTDTLDNPDLTIAEYSITEQDADTLLDLTDNHLMSSKYIFIRNNILDKSLNDQFLNRLREKYNVDKYREEPDIVSINSILWCERKT